MNIKRNTRSWHYVDDEGRTRKYFPDFVVDGVLYEIKGPKRKYDQVKLASVDQEIVYLQGRLAIKPYISYVTETYSVTAENIHSLYE